MQPARAALPQRHLDEQRPVVVTLPGMRCFPLWAAEGFDKALALKSTLEVPLTCVRGASRGPDVPRERHGLRLGDGRRSPHIADRGSQGGS